MTTPRQLGFLSRPLMVGIALAAAISLSPAMALAAWPATAGHGPSSAGVAVTLSPENGLNYVDQGHTCRSFTAQLTDESGSAQAVPGVAIGFSVVADNEARLIGSSDGVLSTKTDAIGAASVTVCATKAGWAEIRTWIDLDGEGDLDRDESGGDAREPMDVSLQTWVSSFISISKTASTIFAHSGDVVTYGYVAGHGLEGGILYDVEVWDDNGTPDDTADDIRIALKNLCDADMDGQDDDLAAGVMATGSIPALVTASVSGTATISGYDAPACSAAGGECSRVFLTASDDATVEVIHPALSLTVTPSAPVLGAGGGQVTYRYLLTNTGDAPVTGVTVTDDACDTLSGPTYETGNSDAVLDATEVWAFECGATVTTTTVSAAAVTAYDALNAETRATAEAVVVVAPFAQAGGVSVYVPLLTA